MSSQSIHQNLDRMYLQKQNRKLKLELKQALHLCELHKSATIRLSEQQSQSMIITVLLQILSKTSNSKTMNNLRDSIMELQGQVMVLQKIINQTYQNQKEVYNLLQNQYVKIQDQNIKNEIQLHKFYQKIGEIDYLSNLVIKYKEISIPNEQAICFKKEEDQLLDMLNLQKEAIKKLTEEKDKLFKINVHMKEEVERKKDELKNMSMIIINQQKNYQQWNSSNMILGELGEEQEAEQQNSILQNQSYYKNVQNKLNFSMSLAQSQSHQSNLNTTLNFVKLQRQLIKEVDEENHQSESDSDLDCPELSILFPDKIQQIKQNKHQSKIPFLNMKKVRELMMKREEKMRKEIEAENVHVNPTNKIIQLETELEITRKELTNQMLKHKHIFEDFKRVQMHAEELQRRNELLIKSNETLNHNYQNIYKDYQLCKSICMEVEKIIGKKINDEKGLLRAKEQLSSIMMSNFNEAVNKHQEDDLTNRVNYVVQTLFKNRVYKDQERSYST